MKKNCVSSWIGLMPLFIILGSIPITVLLMTAICISTAFQLRRMQDITVNLQLPLIYFLGDFFIQMFRGTRPMTLEYFIPMHNSLELISESYMAQEKIWHVIAVLAVNTIVAFLVMRSVYRKESLYDNRKRRA